MAPTDKVTRPRRIFLGLTDVAGYYTHLARGFASIGVHADLLTLRSHAGAYESPPPPRVGDALVAPGRRLRHLASVTGGARGLALRAIEFPVRVATHSIMLVWAACRYDTFIFGFNASFLRTLDLPLLRLLRKRIVVVYHGSDERPTYVDGDTLTGGSGRAISRAAARTRRRIRRAERYATAIISNPLSAQLHSRPFVGIMDLGMPSAAIGLARSACKADGENTTATVIMHAPSRPAVKGSSRIREVIAALRTEGANIRYIEVSGRPNREVHAALANANIVIDQIYSDMVFSVLATEAALHGRAVVVGGYGGDELRRLYPAIHSKVAYCHPDELLDTLRRLVNDPSSCERLGREAHEFVATQWQPLQVATRMLEVILGNAPSDWMHDPRDTRYLEGFGLSQEAAREKVATVITALGTPGLQLGDKPWLEQAYRAFAAGASPDYSEPSVDHAK